MTAKTETKVEITTTNISGGSGGELVPSEPVKNSEETKTTEETPKTEEPLVSDARAQIKDKLIQKYQVRLDEIITQLANRLTKLSPTEQKAALEDLKSRMSEKKLQVLGLEDLGDLKKDVIVAILDHVVVRLEALIKKSSQIETTKPQA